MMKHMDSASGLPTGTVTFLFSDIERSTRLLANLGQASYSDLLSTHEEILRAAFDAHGGQVVDTQGDSFFVVFRRAREAAAAAISGQRGLIEHDWGDGVVVRVRIGLHTGEPLVGTERYVGTGVHRAARLGSAGHGGQVLLSETTQQLLRDDPLEGVSFRDLGVHHFKGLDAPERIFQLCTVGLPDAFPRLRTGEPRRQRLLRTGRGRIAVGSAVVAVVAGIAVAVTIANRPRTVNLVANSVAVIDPVTNRPSGDVPLSFVPGGVTASGDQVWVMDSEGKTATAIDPKTLHVGRTVAVDVIRAREGGDSGAQWAGGSMNWAAGAGAVDQFSADGTATRIALWQPVLLLARPACRAYVTGGRGRVWITDARHLAELNAADGSVLRKVTLENVVGASAGTVCYGAQYSDGRLVAVRDPDESVGYLDPTTGAFSHITQNVGNISATRDPNPGAWSTGLGSLWVAGPELDVKTFTKRAYLKRIDLSTGQTLSRTLVGRDSSGLAIAPATGIWVAGGSANELIRVNSSTAQVTSRLDLGHYPEAVASGHGRIWVTLGST
jgi:class 3 adenylate cyclase